MSKKTIAIATSLEEPLLTILHQWGKRFDWSEVQAVHFIHIVKREINPFDSALDALDGDPFPESFEAREPEIKKTLENESQKIIPQGFKGKIVYHIAYEFEPEKELISILKKNQANLVVLSVQDRKGLAGLGHGSFSKYITKFSPCDIYIARPEST